MTEHFANFSDLMEKRVLKDRARHPHWVRLDETIPKDSPPRIYATFRYMDKIWKVHTDTTFESLLRAMKLAQSGQPPFVISSTRSNRKFPCLRLPDAPDGRAEGLYIYQNG